MIRIVYTEFLCGIAIKSASVDKHFVRGGHERFEILPPEPDFVSLHKAGIGCEQVSNDI